MDVDEKEYPSSSINPVIGVILMVAITVILATVIAIFVFGMSGGLTSPKYTATITVKEVINIGDGIGVIDTDGNGYYWSAGFLPLVELNKKYIIEYYVQEGKRYIYKQNILDESDYNETVLNAFKCKTDAIGVCK
jgi:flagellin-like protein